MHVYVEGLLTLMFHLKDLHLDVKHIATLIVLYMVF